MQIRWVWVGFVATVGALVLGVVVAIATLPQEPYAAFWVGLTIGTIAGAIAFVLALFRGPRVSRAERVSLLESEIRQLDEDLAVARHDAISRSDVGFTVPGKPTVRGKSPAQEAKEVAATAKVERLEGERRSKIDQLARLQRRKKVSVPDSAGASN